MPLGWVTVVFSFFFAAIFALLAGYPNKIVVYYKVQFFDDSCIFFSRIPFFLGDNNCKPWGGKGLLVLQDYLILLYISEKKMTCFCARIRGYPKAFDDDNTASNLSSLITSAPLERNEREKKNGALFCSRRNTSALKSVSLTTFEGIFSCNN